MFCISINSHVADVLVNERENLLLRELNSVIEKAVDPANFEDILTVNF